MSELLKREQNTEPKIETIDDLIDFFLDRSDHPDYAGYDETAAVLKERLDSISAISRSDAQDDIYRIELELKPERDGDPYVMEGSERPGSHALISLVYKVTGAESNIVYQTEDEEAAGWVAVRHGSYEGADIYFLDIGVYGSRTLEVANGIPSGWLTQQA